MKLVQGLRSAFALSVLDPSIWLLVLHLMDVRLFAVRFFWRRRLLDQVLRRTYS
jgi:hypothetical protein